MNYMSLQFQLSFLQKAPPSVEQSENRVIINCPFTLSETMFAIFMQSSIQLSLSANYNLVVLGTSPTMQQDFTQWVAELNIRRKWSQDELNLSTIVSSIWKKTQTVIENELKLLSQNKEALENEKTWQLSAQQTEKQLLLEGISGKVFTVRQAKFLLTFVDRLEKEQRSSDKKSS